MDIFRDQHINQINADLWNDRKVIILTYLVFEVPLPFGFFSLLQLARVSFIHNVRLQFRVILETSHALYQPGEKFMIFVEVLYNNFRDSEFIRDIAGFPNVFNITKSKGNCLIMCLTIFCIIILFLRTSYSDCPD